VIPTVIVVAFFAGLLPVHAAWRIAATVLIAVGWALLVTFGNDGNFFGGFAFGAANAAFGAVVGAGVRAAWQVTPRAGGR